MKPSSPFGPDKLYRGQWLMSNIIPIHKRFRGFLPVVVDVETSGLNAQTDALLEIAVVMLSLDNQGRWVRDDTHHEHVNPFPGANIDPEAMRINGINIEHPFRYAVDEGEALENIFRPVRERLKKTQCQRAVLVGHNAWFDLWFLQAAATRSDAKKNPFHRFTSFDTATLGGLVYGQTVLAKACASAKIAFNQNEAHSAIYDAEKTADLFCEMVNRWDSLEALALNIPPTSS